MWLCGHLQLWEDIE